MKLFAFHGGRRPKDNTLPSMTEIVPQLSVEEIFRDYCRGVVHPSRPGMYDPDDVNDDNFEEVEEQEDFSELFDIPVDRNPIDIPPSAPDPVLEEPSKDEPGNESPADE